jgi:hypothetical protein
LRAEPMAGAQICSATDVDVSQEFPLHFIQSIARWAGLLSVGLAIACGLLAVSLLLA